MQNKILELLNRKEMSKFVKGLFGWGTERKPEGNGEALGLLQSQESAGETKESKGSYGNEDWEFMEIEDSPFVMVSDMNDKTERRCFLVMGNTRMTDKMKKGECIERVRCKDWDLITKVIIQLVKNVGNIDKLIEEAKRVEEEVANVNNDVNE